MAMIANKIQTKKNLSVINIKKLEARVRSIQSYLPILEENIDEKNNKKIASLLKKHKRQLQKFEHGAEPEKYFTELQNAELHIEQDRLYWELRIIENDLNIKLSTNNASAEKCRVYKTENIEKIKNAFLEHEQRLMRINSTYDDKNFKHRYIQEFHRNDCKRDAAILIKTYKDDILALQKNHQLEIQSLREKLEAQKKQKLNEEQEKAKIKIKKLEKAIAELKESVQRTKLRHVTELQNKIKHAKDETTAEKLQKLENLYNPNADTHLLVDNLTMQFGGLTAVNSLSFDVKRGEIFGLIGPNGAGKTTVFNCITQFYKPTKGMLAYKDRADNIVFLTDSEVHNIIKYGIVRTFQNVELIWELSVLDNLLVGAHTSYESHFFVQLFHLPQLKKEEKITTAKALAILKDLDLLPYKDLPPIGLPYGVLKRIELARTLMLEPELIILDEPAAGLNESETLELSALIKTIRDRYKVTVFLVEHDMNLVMDICDRICAISFGKKLALGTPKEIQENALVQEAYLGGDSNE